MFYLKHPDDGEYFSYFVNLNTFGDERSKQSRRSEIQERYHGTNVQLKKKKNSFNLMVGLG
jgi:hypothetical protein